jgi:hypothetical protein
MVRKRTLVAIAEFPTWQKAFERLKRSGRIRGDQIGRLRRSWMSVRTPSIERVKKLAHVSQLKNVSRHCGSYYPSKFPFRPF